MSDPDDPLTMIHPSITPRSSLGSGALSYSSSSISPSTSSSGSHGSAKTAVSECLGAWLNYLQILNNLCASGYRLAQTISALEQWGVSEPPAMYGAAACGGMPPPPPPPSQQPHPIPVATQFVTAWDDLARATAVATSTVKSHIVSVLQDFVTQSLPLTIMEQQEPVDIQRLRDHNQQIIMETAQTMINIQHQFCVASYDSFSPLMCCFVCQAPVGFPHDAECAILVQQQQQQQQQQTFQRNQTTAVGDPRSQTPSPHFAMNFPKNERDIYHRMPAGTTDSRAHLFGSGSSSEHISGAGVQATGTGGVITGIVMEARGPSPHHEIRGPSPIQGFLENIRGPLPNPGHLLGMKTPFYRGSRSPLNFPLFPLNGQRRWSEAAAGEVKGESMLDAESHMRRWSMPWEASSKAVKNTVTWHQTRIMPVSKLAVPTSKSGSSDRSQSTTPDSNWHSSATSQDGLAEAIQLLSCRPSRIYQPPPPPPPLGPPFIEEPQSTLPQAIATYEMWSDRSQRLPCIKFNRDRDDDNQHHT